MANATICMRTSFVLAPLLALTGVACPAATQQAFAPVPSAPLGYQLAWSDEFNGSSVAADQWRPRTDTKMWSRQRPENVSVGGGVLRLRVDRSLDSEVGYSGAGLISRRSFRYGYYEARLRVPEGAGWHTSFWLMAEPGKSEAGAGLPVQEIDVVESDSVKPTRYDATVHRWKPEPHMVLSGKAIKTPDLSKDFHVFGCELTADLATFSFDGQVVRTYDIRSISQGDMHIWLSVIAAGLGGTRNVDNSRLPSAAEIDYVRYFIRK